MSRRRLDAELVRRGLLASRQQASDAIAAGRVTVGGAPALKSTRMVDASEPIELAGAPPRYVSRGGAKLEAALRHWKIDPAGRCALDAGASTGGFTDCLLQHGCDHVTAVDVGYGQLSATLRDDPRVENRERTNVRHLVSGDVDHAVDLVVCDLSFISMTRVIGALVSAAEEHAEFVLLVKPQFEAGKQEASRGKGVIRDPEVWGRVIREVVAACRAADVGIMDVMASPVRGPEGNREFLVHGWRGRAPSLTDQVIADVVAATAGEEARR